MSRSTVPVAAGPASPTVDGAAQMRLEQLDTALGRIRRLWDQPGIRSWFSDRLDLDEVDASVYRTLRATYQLGPEAASVNGIADVLRVDASTASRFLDRAVAAGYIRRSASPRDRRRSSFELTDAGRERLRLLRELRVMLLADLTAGWAAGDVETLTSLLTRIDDAVVELRVE